MRNKIQLSLFLTLLIIGVQGKFATVFANPLVNYSYTGICVGSPTTFSVDSTITIVGEVTIWNWNFGDGNFSTFKNPVHTFAGAGPYVVTLTITDIYGQMGSVTHNVTIEKLPVVNFSYPTPTCSSNSIQFTDLSNTDHGYNERWVWDFGDGSPSETVNFPGDQNIKHTFPNPQTFNVTLSVINTDLCENQASFPVTVTASPVANFSFNGKCEDQVVTFTDASAANGTVSIVSWKWDFGDPTSGIDNESILKDPSHIFSNAGTYTVKLIVTNFNSCADTILKQVFINPHPAVDYTFTGTCLNGLTTFTPDPLITNIPGVATWLWDFGDGITSNSASPSHTFTTSGNFPVTLTITDILGCKNVAFHLVEIVPLPVAHFNVNLSGCAGTTVQFQNQSSFINGNIVQWNWDFGDGNSVIVNNPANPDVSHVYISPGNYTVQLAVIASNGCTNKETQQINVLPDPVANFDFTTACIGTAVGFTDLTQLNGASSIVQWQWDFGDTGSGILNNSTLQNPEHVFSTAGNHTVQLVVTSGNGCNNTIVRTLLVNPPPPVNFLTSQSCQNNTVIFSPDALVMNLATISSWFWEFGTGSTSALQNPSYAYATPGTYNVKLTIVDNYGCSSTIAKPVIITPQPTADFSYLQPACMKSSVLFTNLSNTTTGIIVKSEWDFGDGNVQAVPGLASVSHAYNSVATYNVMLTVTTSDSCKKSITLPVVILPLPLANFTFISTCLNSPVQFNDYSQPGSGVPASWLWNFGDAASGENNVSAMQNPAHTFNAAGTFQVTLIVTNTSGCLDTIVKPLQVHGLPFVDFTSAPGCVNNTTQFVSSTFVNAGAVISRQWNFGDGFTSANIDPTHIYSSSGSFTVTLTVTDTSGCINTKTHTVNVLAPPVSLFQVSAQTCSMNAVLFTNLSSATAGTITSFHWEFGDGSDTLIIVPANGIVSHIYSAAGNYTVALTVHTSLGCEAKSQRSFNVSASPLAQFSASNTCEATAVSFNDLSMPNSGTSIVNWSWNFNDPSTGPNNISNLQNPFHSFNTPGTYTVLLQVGNASGCIATLSKAIVIKSKPAVDFNWIATCFDSPATFSMNATVTDIAAVTSYDWDFGDGTSHNTTQKNPVHTYTLAGNYTTTLTITNTDGCKNMVSHSVSILAKPSASFSTATACSGMSAQFSDQSISSSGVPITAWHWDFGVNTTTNDTSVQQNPSWIYTAKGVYDVKLTVTTQNGCQDVATRSMQVYGIPTADFSYTASACENGNVRFQNTSFSQQATIVSSNWKFDTDNYSFLQNPSYDFYTPDSCYDVRLIVTDNRGCIDTTMKEVCVPAEFDITFSTSSTCMKDSTYFMPQVIAPSSGSLVIFKWNFGDQSSGNNNTSTNKFPSHYYAQPGTYTISFEATDINNCNKTIYKNITIFPLPVPEFTYTTGVCDSTVYFNESSSGNGSNISRWVWDFGDGFTTTVVSPGSPDVSHLYVSPGAYIVNLTVINTNGCSSSIMDSSILIKPCLDAAFDLVDDKVCQNNLLSFANNSFSSLPINNWYWDFGDGTHVTFESYSNRVNHVYKSPGAFTVRLIISTFVAGRKISDTAHMIVNVSPSPLPDFTYGVVCNEQEAVFTNITSGSGIRINKYGWTFGEPASAPDDTSSVQDPVHLYHAPGTYEVTLMAENIIGCRDSIHKLLIVSGLPDANFKTALSCVGSYTSFTDLSTGAGAPIMTWKWTFNDNMGVVGGAETQNPEFIFKKPGDYMVNLKVSDANGCHDSVDQYISSWDKPTGAFTFVENYDEVQGQLQFINSSADASKYQWTFGNGDVSYAEKPVELYMNEGTFDITLVAYNDKGCTDTLSKQYKFMVKGLFIPNAFSPLNPIAEVQLLKPVGINLKEYRFEVYDRWGYRLWWTDKLDSEGRPTEGWNGTFKDILMPEGAYLWRAFGIFKDGSIWQAENIGESKNLPRFKTGTASMIR